MHINSVQWRPCLHAAKRFACHAFWAEQESGDDERGIPYRRYLWGRRGTWPLRSNRIAPQSSERAKTTSPASTLHAAHECPSYQRQKSLPSTIRAHTWRGSLPMPLLKSNTRKRYAARRRGACRMRPTPWPLCERRTANSWAGAVPSLADASLKRVATTRQCPTHRVQASACQALGAPRPVPEPLHRCGLGSGRVQSDIAP